MDINADSLSSDFSDVSDSVLLSKFQDIVSNIELLTDDYLKSHNIVSLKELTQQEYSGYLMYIAMKYFKPTKILYKHIQGVSNNKQITLMYDDDLLTLLCEYYIYMSLDCNKVVNMYSFSLFSGIDDDTLTRWTKEESQRPKAYGITKRLSKAYEKSLENGAQSGKNPVGFIATLNHRFGWNADNKPSLTVNITRTQNEIMSTFDNALLSDNSEKTH